MKSAAVALSTLLIAAAAPARAADPSFDCAAFKNDVASTVRAVKSCSDAIYLRRDVEEADAVCKAADAISAVAAERYQALKADPADQERAACAAESRTTAVQLVAAMEWVLSYQVFRLDRHKNALPRPFAG